MFFFPFLFILTKVELIMKVDFPNEKIWKNENENYNTKVSHASNCKNFNI